MRHCIRHLSALALFAALSSAACTDLTEVPYTEITDENFKPTEGDLGAMMAPVYTPMRNIWMGWYGMVDWQGETADMLLTPVRPNGWDDGGVYLRNHEHTWNASTPGMPNNLWLNAYSGISNANHLIYWIESGRLPLSDARREAILAELRAARAYYYYLLLDNFGNVPVVTDYTDKELPEQKTRKEVYDFVVQELLEVIPKLPVDHTSMYGRLHQWAAKTLLARVYLNAEVYTGTPQWDQVLALTEDIMNSGRFRLDATYRGPFSRNNHQSPEIIFAVPYDAVYGQCSNFHMKTLKPDLRYVFNLNAGPWGGSAANPQFIDTYDPDDGRLKDTWLMGPHFDSQGRGYNFVKHVPSMRQTEFHHGYPVWKYEIYPGMTGCSDVDYPDMRYAEVLMMRAEALLRKGDADGAAALVTQVRERNFTGAAAHKAVVTGAELLQGSRYNYGWYDTDGVVKDGPGGNPVTDGGADVKYGRFYDELRWEFAIEGRDRQMAIRFGVFTTKMWFNHRPTNSDHIILFPIPQAQIDANPKLKQNPGY